MFGQLPKGHKLFKRLANALIRLRVYAGWSDPLLVSHTTLLEIPCRGSIHFLKMIFSNDTSVFISESCVSDNPIRYERTRTPTNDHEYYHGTTRNDPDPATVELRFRPRPQSNTIHPDEFKRFKLVVALSWRLPNHQESSRITTVLLGFAPMSLRCCYDSCRCITT